MTSPKRGRPPGTKSLVIFIQPDADAWLRAEATRAGVAVGALVELAIRRMMASAKKSEPAQRRGPSIKGVPDGELLQRVAAKVFDDMFAERGKKKPAGEKIKVVKL